MKTILRLCPDPTLYVPVTTENGIIFRLRRGTLKPAPLNNALKKHAAHLKMVSPAASRMLQLLKHYTQNMQTRKLFSSFTGHLLRAMNSDGTAHFGHFMEMELHQDHPLRALLRSTVTVKQDRDMLHVSFSVSAGCVPRINTLVTEYCFELVLLFGDPAEPGDLRIDSSDPTVYSFDNTDSTTCILSMQVPTNKPWMAMLKAACKEGNDWTINDKGYGMKVIATSFDQHVF